jgi:uncharacterized protein (DUF4213/DUF364 family)
MSNDRILSAILRTLPNASVKGVYIGLHWTAVVVEKEGKQQCGIAATLKAEHNHEKGTDVTQAGELTKLEALELAQWVKSHHVTQVSIGMATVNALLPQDTYPYIEKNASEILLEKGKGKHVCLVGHFSFVDQIRDKVGKLSILELNPRSGDLPASLAPEIIPAAYLLAITGMTFINRTLEQLLSYCNPKTYVMVLGPSTPLTPLLFEYGIHYISGAI